jgi:glycosyltransferase involved in cell wall biosynthesis
MTKIVVISNNVWNILNFRKGVIDLLLKNKLEVHIITFLPNSFKNPFLKNVIFHNIKIDRRGINPIKELLLIFNLYKVIENIKPLVILNFTIKPVIYGSLISRILKIATINTITGMGRVFIIKKLYPIKLLINQLYKISQKKVNLIFFHNKEDYNYFIKKKISFKHNSQVINGSGVNLIDFKYQEPNIKQKISFITISRLTYEKGIYDLINAIKILKKNNYNIEFNLLGDFEKVSQGGISKKLLEQWVNEDLIVYRGFVKDVKKYIIQSDALIHPSHREGSSKSIQESMSLGRPIIASNCEGNLESVENNFNGLIFEMKNYNSLFKTITYFTNLNKQKRIQLSINARKTAEEKFDSNKLSNEYLKKINQIIKDL